MGTNKNMLMAYGGMALPVLALAVFMFTRGNFTSILVGIFIIAFAGMGGTIFHTSLRHSKKLGRFNAWLEGKPAPEKTKQVSEIEAEFASLEDKTDKAEKELKKEEKSSAGLVNLVTQFTSYVKSFSPKEKRKQIQAAQAQAVEEVKEKLLKTGEGISVELATSKKILASVIAELDKEVEAAKKLNADPKRGAVARKKQLSELEKALKKDVAAYAKALKDQDSEKKIARLRSLEEQLTEAMDQDIDQLLFKEVGRAESDARKLEDLRGRIQWTVKRLQEEIKPDWRDPKYDEMQTKLDQIDKAVDNLIPAAKEHHRLAMQASRTVKEFHEHIVGLKQSKFIEMRVIHAAQAEIARENAEAAARKINDLESRLAASEKENAELRANVAALEKNLGDVNATLQRWKDDLAEAREVSKRSKDDLESALIDRLAKNVDEQEGLITRMIRTLVAKEQLRSSEESRAKDAEDQLAESNRRIANLERAEKELTESKESLEAEQRALLENKAAMEEDMENLNKELTKLAPEIEADVRDQLKKEHEEAIRERQERLEDIKTEMSAVQAENAKLEEELADTQSKLNESKNEAGRFQAAANAAESAARDVNDSLISARAELAKVTKEKDAEISELKKKESLMESNIAKAEKDLASLRKELKEKTQLWQDESSQATHWFEQTHLESKNAAKFEERMKKYLKARDELKDRLRAAEVKNKALQAARENLIERSEKSMREMREWRDRYERETVPMKEAAARNEIEVQRLQRLLVKERDDVAKLNFELEESKKAQPQAVEDEDMTEFINNLTQQIKEKTTVITELEKEKNIIETAKKEAEERAEQAASQKAALDSKIERMRAEHEHAKADLEHQIDEKTLIIEGLTNDLDEADGKASEQERRITALEQTGEQQIRNLRELNQKIEEAKRQGTAGAQSLQRTLDERNQLVQDLSDQIEEKDGIIAELSELRDTLIDNNEKIIHEATMNIAAVEGAKNVATTEMTLAKNEADSLKEQKIILENNIAELRRRIAGLEPQAVHSTRLQNELESEREKLGSRQAELTAANEELQRQLTLNQELAKQNEQFRQQLESLQQQITQAGKDREENLKRKEREARRDWFNEKSSAFRQMAQKIQSIEFENPELPKKISEAEAEYGRILKEFLFNDKEKQTLEAFYELIQQKNTELQRISHQASTQPTPTQASPPPVPLAAQAPKAIAIGDVHGDVHRLHNLLVQAKIIDQNWKWIANKDTQIIMLGDYIDRGVNAFRVLDLLKYLKNQAGSQLKLLCGNHEAMFLGAFDWEGYDKKLMGSNKALATYAANKAKFDEEVKNRGLRNDIQKDELLKTMGTFRGNYMRIENLKMNWWMNDWMKVDEQGNQVEPGHSATLHSLGIKDLDFTKDASKLLDAKYTNPDTKTKTSVRDYLKFLRETLEVYHEVSDENIIFVHAGIPYKVPNPDSMDFTRHGSFQGYIFGDDLKNMMEVIKTAIRTREVQLWMAFGETSPLFACNPANRNLEWDSLSQYNEDMIKSVFGLNAVVFGHSQGPPQEHKYITKYIGKGRDKGKIRHNFNIDFGMSYAYNKSLGGWLSVNADETITVNVIDGHNKIHKYEYEYKTEAEKKTRNGNSATAITQGNKQPTKA